MTRLRIFLSQERTYEARKVHVLVCVSLERVQSRFGGAPKTNRRIESAVVSRGFIGARLSTIAIARGGVVCNGGGFGVYSRTTEQSWRCTPYRLRRDIYL